MDNLEAQAEICGIHAGDGWLSSYNNEVGYGTSLQERQYFDYVFNLYRETFDLFCYRILERDKRYNTIELRIQSKNLQQQFRSWGFPRGPKNLKLIVPPFIRKHPELQRCFLRGLVDTDGSVHWRWNGNNFYLTITWNFTSEKFALKIRKMLELLGYRSTFYGSSGKGNRKTVWKIQLQNIADVRRFLKEIGFNNDKGWSDVFPGNNGKDMWTREDSNLRSPPCEGGILPLDHRSLDLTRERILKNARTRIRTWISKGNRFSKPAH